ncbi:MAG: YSIRK-type signal peptide-containing protein, partial [Lactobacillus sp.]|nr:YSIRK-type signal peptide-containing protein [Lactobacillus sp.]
MKKTFNKGESHQRFSIRKLSIGVASVLVGSTFMVISGEQVHADETNVDDASQKTDDNASEDQSDHVKVQSDQQDVVVTKKDQILDTADASATAKEEPKAEDVTELKVSENVANNAKNVTTSDADVKNNVVSESKVATKDSQVTEQDYLNALGYGEMELSDEQLAKLGLTRDTYIDNGVKYKAKGILDISLTNGSTLHFDNVQPPHADNGSMLDPNE